MSEISSATLRRTPLYDTHLAAGARMVDFGGWHMPVAYGSQIDEHHAVRREAGMFDVSHMRVVDVQGSEALDFVRVLLANDAAKLKWGKALYSCMLNARGGVIDDLIVYARSEGSYRLVVNASTADKDIAWIRQVQAGQAGPQPLAVRITPHPELALIAVQGPHALERARTVLETFSPSAATALASLTPFGAASAGDFFIARTGYTGEDGCEIALPAAQAPELWSRLKAAGVRECGLGARDTLRLEAGMALWGNDMDEAVSPLDAGLAWTVDMTSPRAFIGRAALEQNGAQRAFVGLKLLDKGVLRAHQAVQTAHGAGEITSGTFSPTLGFSIAMARVPLSVALGDTVHVDIRGKALPAQVVKMPFVRQGKALI